MLRAGSSPARAGSAPRSWPGRPSGLLEARALKPRSGKRTLPFDQYRICKSLDPLMTGRPSGRHTRSLRPSRRFFIVTGRGCIATA